MSFKAEDFQNKTFSQVKQIVWPLGDEIIAKIVELSDDPRVIELANVIEHNSLTTAARMYCSALGHALHSRPGVTVQDRLGYADCFMAALGFEGIQD